MKKLTTLRKRIAELNEEIEWATNAPLPKDEVIARNDAWVDRLANKWAPGFDLFGPNARPDEAKLLEAEGLLSGRSVGEEAQLVGRAYTDLAPMMAALMPEVVKALLKRYVDTAQYEAGPPSADRPEIIQSLNAERLKLEREEESLIVEAEAAGQFIDRREDVDPAVVLEWVT